MDDCGESRFLLDEIEERGRERYERNDRLVASATLVRARLVQADRAVQFARLARERAAKAARRAVALRIELAAAHERIARACELAGADGFAGDFQARATRYRQLSATGHAAAAAMASRARMDGNASGAPPRPPDGQ